MGSITSIGRKSSGDPLRSVLAEAIVAAQAGRGELEEHAAALDRARGLVASNEAKVEGAAAVVENERNAQASRLATSLRTKSAAPSGGALRAARSAHQDCLDDLETSRAALERLEGEDRLEIEREQMLRMNAVISARNAVLAEVAKQVVASGRAARRALRVAEAVAVAMLQRDGKDERDHELHFSGVDTTTAQSARLKPIAEISAAARNLFLAGTTDEEAAAIADAVDATEQFIKALDRDAEAEAPEF